MPIETGRIIKRKRINLPSGDTVDIPVVTQITFDDVVGKPQAGPAGSGSVQHDQEYEFHIENGSAGNRDVHVASIPGGGDPTDESGGGGSHSLSVERIDVWRVRDVVERGQESFIHLDNKTIQQPPDAPPYFTTHEKTHVVKYINTPDDGNWIKAELIDRFKVRDVVEQGQETEYFLFNPPDNTGIKGLTLGTDNDGPTIAVDPGMDEIADALDPVRTDPYQNIVDWRHREGTTGGGGPSTEEFDVRWVIEGDPWNSGENNDGVYNVRAGGGQPYAPTDVVLGTYTTLYAQDGHLLAGVMTDISVSGITTVTATFADAREAYGSFSFTAPSSISVPDPFPPHETVTAFDAISSHASKSGSIILGKPIWWEGIFAVTYQRRT